MSVGGKSPAEALHSTTTQRKNTKSPVPFSGIAAIVEFAMRKFDHGSMNILLAGLAWLVVVLTALVIVSGYPEVSNPLPSSDGPYQP